MRVDAVGYGDFYLLSFQRGTGLAPALRKSTKAVSERPTSGIGGWLILYSMI